MHDHLYYPAPGRNVAMYPEHAWSFPRLYLAAGVTTIRTTGSVEPYTDLELKKDTDEGKMPGPKMHVTGPYLEGKGAYTPQMHELQDAEDARRTVDYWIAEGVENFKAYMNITRDELRTAVEEAHKHKLKVTGHLCSIGFREAAQIGIDDLEHGIVVDSEFAPSKQQDKCPPQKDIRDTLLKLDINGEQIQSMIKDLVAHHVALTSTLPVFKVLCPIAHHSVRQIWIQCCPKLDRHISQFETTCTRMQLRLPGRRSSKRRWTSNTRSRKQEACCSQA